MKYIHIYLFFIDEKQAYKLLNYCSFWGDELKIFFMTVFLAASTDLWLTVGGAVLVTSLPSERVTELAGGRVGILSQVCQTSKLICLCPHDRRSKWSGLLPHLSQMTRRIDMGFSIGKNGLDRNWLSTGSLTEAHKTPWF